VEVTLIPLLIDELVVGVYGIAKDTTAQREAVAALESMEARYRSAFEYAPTAMALVAPSGRYLAVNRALSQLLGYSEQELLAMSWLDLTPPDAYEAELAVAQKLLSGEFGMHCSPLRYRHKHGHSVCTERRLLLARDGGYEPLYFICEIVERLPPREQPWRHVLGRPRFNGEHQGHQSGRRAAT
jgi:PAS domain S-box-containing protein